MSCIIQYKKSRNYHFGRFYDAILLVYEAIKHLNVKKKKKNTLKICENTGIDPGPLASWPNTLATRPRGKVVRHSK